MSGRFRECKRNFEENLSSRLSAKTIDLVMISFLVLRPCGGWNEPSRIIHLSSQSFSLWHSPHLQPAPPWWPASLSLSEDVSIWSRREKFRCLMFPVSWCSGHYQYAAASRIDKFSPGRTKCKSPCGKGHGVTVQHCSTTLQEYLDKPSLRLDLIDPRSILNCFVCDGNINIVESREFAVTCHNVTLSHNHISRAIMWLCRW